MSETGENARLVIDTGSLRYAIREAVERETATRYASIIQEVQKNALLAQQLDRESAVIRQRVIDIEETLKGDPTKGIPGVLPTLGRLEETIKKIGGTLEDFTASVKLAKWLLGLIVALGLFDTLGVANWIKSLMGLPL